MKTLAFVIGLYIATVGAIALLLPSGLLWVDQHFITPGTFFLAVIVRIAFGFVLISAASASRTPKALRVLGYIIVIIGIAMALTALLDMEWARAAIARWLQLGSTVVRLTGILVLALGCFIAYACAPARRAA